MSNAYKIKIKPFGFLDLLSFKNLVPQRKKRFANTPATELDSAPPMNVLASRLHPVRQHLVIEEIRDEAPGVKSFILVPDPDKGTKELSYFRAGQYLSIKVDVDGVVVTRPYSIASSPAESLKGYYTITVKRQERGFITDRIFDTWEKGMKITASGPEGQFYYDRIRDSRHLAGIAGGCGITPFMSMARDFEEKGFPVDFTLFYGCNTAGEIIYRRELDELAGRSGGRFRVVYAVCGEKPFQGAEEGFITGEIIKKHITPAECSFFICGPQAMYEFAKKEIAAFGLPVKQIRREVFGEIKNIREHKNYPKGVKESFSLTVTMGTQIRTIPALAEESLLVSMERAGMNPPSKCRSGVCSFCRSELISGDLFIPEDTDGRRRADREYAYIHACSSYPISDLEIRIPTDEV